MTHTENAEQLRVWLVRKANAVPADAGKTEGTATAATLYSFEWRLQAIRATEGERRP